MTQSLRLLLLLVAFSRSIVPTFGVESTRDNRPVVGVVLSGGGARGGAHIGVLKKLEEAGVPIDVISGTSFGALVGGLYAAGFSTDDLELLVSNVDWDELFEDRVDRQMLDLENKKRSDMGFLEIGFSGLDVDIPTGLMTGQKIRQLLDRLTTFPTLEAGNDFNAFRIPFRAVAADILTGEAHVFQNGSLAEAIRASIAVPFLFTPVETEGTWLVDGGISDNIPVDAALEAGADIIIAVDISTPLKKDKAEIQSVFDVIDQVISFRIEEKKRESLQKAHFVIQPDLTGYSSGDFDKMEQLVQVGYEGAALRMEQLKQFLAESSVPTGINSIGKSLLDPQTFDLRTTVVGDSELSPARTQVRGLRDDANLGTRLGKLPDTVRGSDLSEIQSELYATNRFDEVTYRIGLEQGAQLLTFEFKEKPPVQLGVGLRYDRDYKFTGAADFLAQLPGGSGSEVGVRALFGNVENLAVRFRARPWLQSFFFEPTAYYLAHSRRAYSGNAFVLDLRDKRLGFFLPAGLQLGRHSRVTAGYRFEELEGRLETGDSADPQKHLAGPELAFEFDSLDSADFPSEGYRLHATYQYREAAFGSEIDLWRTFLETEGVVGLTARSSITVTGSWGIVDGDEIPAVERFFTGGGHYLSFSSLPFFGLSRDQVVSQHFATAGLGYRHLLKSYPLKIVRRIYLGGKYQAGLFNKGEDLTKFRSVLHGYGGGVYLDFRFLGPIAIELAGTDEKDFNFYFSIGYPF